MKTKTKLLPKEKRILQQLGENIRLARKRRRFSAEVLAERANISRTTLWAIEKGESNTSITSFVRVLSVMGLDIDLLEVGKDDVFGRKLQDIETMNKNQNSDNH